MIINLTKKTIISNKPNFRLARFLRAGIVPRNSFLDSDCIVFQNCKMAFNLSKLEDIEVVFTDTSNSVCKIFSSSELKFFLRASKSFTILILPKGSLEKTFTEIGDLIDLSAELTAQTRKNLGFRSDSIVIPVPDTAMMKATGKQGSI